METPLTVLYTGGLRGDLDLLPRLYSFLRQLRAHYREEVVQVCQDEPARPPGSTLLIDLGDSCAPDVWHCAVSGGRSTLVVLDGMGFDAARVDDAAAKRIKMGDSIRLALVDADTPHALDDLLLTADTREGDSPGRPHSLHISLSPADETRLDGDSLSLRRVEAGQVGAAQLVYLIGRWSLVAHEVHDLPARALPDPTIAASVDFVLAEARYAQKRQSKRS